MRFTFSVLLFLAMFNAAASAQTAATPTGIALDSGWKVSIYEYAKENVKHPSWGLAHSERDYQNTLMLAGLEGFPLDRDVLFASAFLHDLGGIFPFAKKGVDHAVRSVELAQPLLQQWGFPMEKWPQVREMILGHTYYGSPPQSPAALAFRDADILDFLGYIGMARIIATTEESGRSSFILGPSLNVLRSFAAEMPARLSLPSAKRLAEPRVQEIRRFLKALLPETFGGKAT